MCVLHATAGTQSQADQVAGTISWFQNPDSQVSSHYLIGLKGEVYQCVNETLNAWHANSPGLPDFNSRSIGIELAQQAGKSDYTNPQLGSLINLLSWLVTRYDIVQSKIVTHASLNSGKSDPLGWAKFNTRIMKAVFDPTAPHGMAQPPSTLKWDKIVYFIEEAMRGLEAEGFQAESNQIKATYWADAVKHRDQP